MFCALLTSRYQVSVYRTNGPLVLILGLRILNIKVGGGGKKKKYQKNFFLFNLKHIWIGEKQTNKNCMILYCKNAEMTIVISAFLQCKIIQFFFFFFNI